MSLLPEEMHLIFAQFLRLKKKDMEKNQSFHIIMLSGNFCVFPDILLVCVIRIIM